VSKTLATVALLIAGTAALGAAYFAQRTGEHPGASHPLAQTLLRAEAGAPLELPALVAADGSRFAAERLRGRWSVVFFGFTSCPDVCPTTLALLSEVAQGAGDTQFIFVTVDPERDTPERLKAYLAYFDPRFVGLTGARTELERFTAALGAGAAPSGSGGFDHSSSLFALDPHGRLAGVLLRPAEPARIVADLQLLRSGMK
jgi:protein SCO1/2